MSNNYYDILGVAKTASENEIKAAYHRLAKTMHPDKATTPEQKATLEREFAAITTAYNVLKDQEKRAAYDSQTNKAVSNATGSGPAAVSPSAGAPTAASISGGNQNLDKSRAAVAKRAFLKGLQLLQSGDYAKAAEYIETAIKNDDTNPSHHYKLAQALMRGKRSFTRAETAAKRAIELDQYNSEYRHILGEIYEAVGSISRAVEVYQEILRWDPTNEKAMVALNQIAPPKKLSLLDRLFGKK